MATKRFNLIAVGSPDPLSAWQDLGPTPINVRVVGADSALIVVDTAAPTDLGADATVLTNRDDDGRDFTAAGQRVYARALASQTKVAVTPTGATGGGSGGGAASIADGADATQGAKADTQATDDTGAWSVVSLLKRISAGVRSTITAVLSTGPASDGFVITPNDTTNFPVNARAIYVGGGGDVNLVSLAGTSLLHKNVPAGTTLVIGARRINVANTTATNMIGYV